MADRLRFKEFALERLPATRCRAKVVLSFTDDDGWTGEAEGLATQSGELRTAADACVIALTKAIATAGLGGTAGAGTTEGTLETAGAGNEGTAGAGGT